MERRFWEAKPDVLIFTHNHLDHYDPETVEALLSAGSQILVLAPESVWHDVRKFGGNHNYVLFNRHTSWTENGITFTAAKAEHSDPAAIGVLMDDGNRKYYITGDTLYNEEIFRDLPGDIDALFLPVNGVGNNMNITDAVRFAAKVGAKSVFPIHIGMFDNLSADNFPCKNKSTLKIYEETAL